MVGTDWMCTPHKALVSRVGVSSEVSMVAVVCSSEYARAGHCGGGMHRTIVLYHLDNNQVQVVVSLGCGVCVDARGRPQELLRLDFAFICMAACYKFMFCGSIITEQHICMTC